jgi:rhamnosyltransferase
MYPSRISILIPTWNGADHLPALLDAIDQQSTRPDEIVAVDSGSTDGTVKLLESRRVRVHQIPAGEFNHGETRNVGVTLTSGDLVVLIVQDAVPIGSGWLEALVRPLDEDCGVAGTFARQVPLEDAGAVTRWNLQHWVAASTAPRVVGPFARETFDTLSAMARLDACAFDNVCSCIRRTAWERHRFARVPIAEDLEWSRDVLLDGWKIAYAPAACVRHSHDRSAAYEWRRTYLVHRRLMELFGLAAIPSFGGLLASVGQTMMTHARICVRERSRWKEVRRALALAVAWPAGQYLGARDARRGAPPRTFAGV